MKDNEKIESLRKLLKTVQENTKRELGGRGGNVTSEARATKKVLECLLGRDPTDDEISLAQAI